MPARIQRADPLHKTKTSTVLAFCMGFAEELQKIATLSGPTQVMGTSKTIKTKTPLPKKVSQPLSKEPDPPASTADQLSSTRTIVPPPVTAAGAN